MYFCRWKSIGEQSVSDVHNLAMTLRRANLSISFFLFLYCSDAVLDYLTCSFNTQHHFYSADSRQVIMHFLHLRE